MKKTVSLLTAVLLAVTFVCASFPAQAVTYPSIWLEPVSNDGNTAVYDLMIRDNSGIAQIIVSLVPSWISPYDEDAAERVAAAFSGRAGTIFSETDFGYPGSGMNISAGENENVTANGVIATVTIQLAGLPSDAKIDLVFRECYNMQTLDVVFINGSSFGETLDSYPLLACKHAHTEVRGAVAATCTAAGYTGDTYCKDCGKKIATGSSIAKKAHTVVTDKAVAADCTHTGLTEGSHCSACGTVIKAQTVTAALGHNYVAVVTAPTATEKGYTTHTCSRCGDSYVDSYTDPVAPATLWGDVNGDGSVNTKDLTLLRSYLANLNPETNVSLVTVQAGADCNGDGTVNTKDLTLLRAYLANFDPETGLSAVVLGPQK